MGLVTFSTFHTRPKGLLLQELSLLLLAWALFLEEFLGAAGTSMSTGLGSSSSELGGLEQIT